MKIEDLKLDEISGGSLAVGGIILSICSATATGAWMINDGIKKKNKNREDESSEMEILFGSMLMAAGATFTVGFIRDR